ncbi:MAG: glycosyltransferase [Candidatus Omnitrophica bacterium]|nr:glycosyltransferase [Candidatus Omnitrophota bacterium]
MQKRISAIVSTYNSEKFIQGCLDNLLAQTVARDMEIIVINSASRQGEEAIAREYLRRHDNIKYYKTRKRETLYASWNRAIRMSSGKYLISANTDDRSRLDALEIMAQTLDENPQIALVYSNCYLTNIPNDDINSMNKKSSHLVPFRAMDYSHKNLLRKCLCGSRPMWRRRLHEELGGFDETCVISGDYDFWLRIAERYPMMRLPEFLHLRYTDPSCLSKSKPWHFYHKEAMRIKRRYFTNS